MYGLDVVGQADAESDAESRWTPGSTTV